MPTRKRQRRTQARKAPATECGFERLPDELVMRILSLASVQRDPPAAEPEFHTDRWLGRDDWPGAELPLSAKSLCRLGEVCARWRQLAPQVESVAWEFRYHWEGSLVAKLVGFVEKAQLLKGLKIYREYDLGPIPAEDLQTILEGSPQLTTLELYQSVVDDSYESDEEVEGREERTGIGFNSQQLFEALSSCPQLVTANLWLEHLDLVRPFKLTQPFQSLRKLTLCTQGTIVSDGMVSGAAVSYLVRYCPNLQCLTLKAEPDRAGKLFLGSASLEILDLVDFVVLRLKLEAPRLSTLRLGWCPDKTVLDTPQLVTFHCANASFKAPGFSLAIPWKVEELVFGEEIDQEELVAGLVLCPRLKRLDLIGLSFPYGYFDLRILRALAGLKHLEELLIDSKLAMVGEDEVSEGGDFDLTPDNIRGIILPRLKSLRVNLATTECLSFAGLFVLQAPSLQELQLGAGDLNPEGCNCLGPDGLCQGIRAEILAFRLDAMLLNPKLNVQYDLSQSEPASDLDEDSEVDPDSDDSDFELGLSDVHRFLGLDSESEGREWGSESDDQADDSEAEDDSQYWDRVWEHAALGGGLVNGAGGNSEADESEDEDSGENDQDVGLESDEEVVVFDHVAPVPGAVEDEDDVSDWEEGMAAWDTSLETSKDGGTGQNQSAEQWSEGAL